MVMRMMKARYLGRHRYVLREHGALFTWPKWEASPPWSY